MIRAILLVLALLPLAGCGRAGPPRPPGPREAITYPRAYPAPDPLPPMTLPPSTSGTSPTTPADLLAPAPPMVMPPAASPPRFGFPRY